ncbi:MAG TPA: 30S ribosomal protein S17 [Armatimonadota bacterium]|nr:30S ribosomal protein S17 [Armatimonadota bacterium]
MEENVRAHRKTREGVVISDKMQKTVVVKVERLVTHPLYRRIMKRSSTFKAHNDERIAARTGDKVRIMETRPISKDKCWRVIEVIERAK